MTVTGSSDTEPTTIAVDSECAREGESESIKRDERGESTTEGESDGGLVRGRFVRGRFCAAFQPSDSDSTRDMYTARRRSGWSAKASQRGIRGGEVEDWVLGIHEDELKRGKSGQGSVHWRITAITKCTNNSRHAHQSSSVQRW